MERKNVLIVFVVATLLTSGLTLPIQPAYATSVLYGIDGAGGATSTLYIIDKTSGAFVPVGTGIGADGCGAMDFDPATGILWAICGNGIGSGFVLITIDETTGALTSSVPVTGSIALLGQSTGVFDISFRNGDSTLYVSTIALGNLVELHTITLGGASSLLGLTGTSIPGNGIAFDPTDTFLFHSDRTTFNDLSQVTGTATLIAPTTNVPPITPTGRNNAMDVDPDTGILYASTNDGASGGGGPTGPNYLSTVAGGTVTAVGIGTPTVTGLDAIAFLPEEDELEECFVHVEWTDPLFLPPIPNPPTAPIEFDDDCQGGQFNTAILPTLTCVPTGGPFLCIVDVPNFIDDFNFKNIFIDITYDPIGPAPTASSVTGIFLDDPTLPDFGGQTGVDLCELVVSEIDVPGLFLLDFECEPNPDWERILFTLEPNVQKLQIWTESFGLPVPVGGSDVSINTSALLLAGIQSISMWMIPVVIAGIGIGIFVIKRRN